MYAIIYLTLFVTNAINSNFIKSLDTLLLILWLFADFKFKDLSFSFNFYEDGTLLKYFAFNLSEDYPGK